MKMISTVLFATILMMGCSVDNPTIPEHTEVFYRTNYNTIEEFGHRTVNLIVEGESLTQGQDIYIEYDSSLCEYIGTIFQGGDNLTWSQHEIPRDSYLRKVRIHPSNMDPSVDKVHNVFVLTVEDENIDKSFVVWYTND